LGWSDDDYRKKRRSVREAIRAELVAQFAEPSAPPLPASVEELAPIAIRRYNELVPVALPSAPPVLAKVEAAVRELRQEAAARKQRQDEDEYLLMMD